MRKPVEPWCLLLIPWLLAACASQQPLARAWEAAPPAECGSPGDDRCVVLGCEEGLCGFFSCEDVVAKPPATEDTGLAVEPVLARRTGLPMGPARPGRWWRRSPWLRGGSEPVMTFQWYAARPLPPRPPALPAPCMQKHHIFPQAPDLAARFKARGINIHDYTMRIPEHLHRRIHGGGPEGGMWNKAWRQFFEARRGDVTREEIYRHAGELIYRFELTGSVGSYYRQAW